jgi:hypothetical protein
VLREYVEYYHAHRTHRALEHDCPALVRLRWPGKARSSNSPGWVGCTTATRVRPPDTPQSRWIVREDRRRLAGERRLHPSGAFGGARSVMPGRIGRLPARLGAAQYAAILVIPARFRRRPSKPKAPAEKPPMSSGVRHLQWVFATHREATAVIRLKATPVRTVPAREARGG